MKSKRHETILEIISDKDIETQEELIAALAGAGFKVTQATVSRDIRELKLVKVTSESGKYKYTAPSAKGEGVQQAYSAAFAASVKSVDSALNTVVIKTYPGLAQAVAAGIDALSDIEIMGCVAGDDTIFALTRSEDIARETVIKLKNLSL